MTQTRESLQSDEAESEDVSPYAFTDRRLSGLAKKVFLDRYAAKELDATKWKEGTTVVAMVSEDPLQPLLRTTIMGPIRSIHEEFGELKVYVEDELGQAAHRMHAVDPDSIEYPYEQHPSETWHRTAKALAQVEAPHKRQEIYNQFAWALDDFKIVPGGRVNAGAGTDNTTLMNCFVLRSPKDSRGGILNTLWQMVEVMARSGGVGINLSTLRPKRAIVHGVHGHSSGSVSWGGIYSYGTGLVEQGGSRRGALMLMLNDWHPDILEFITVKQKMGVITNANLSVCVSDALMEAKEKDEDWKLEFPVTSHPAYKREWDGNLAAWKAKGYPVKVYATVKARYLWRLITESAWKSAEPGVVFIDYANAESPSYYYNTLVCTNPCGEQPLPPNAVCNLAAVNLAHWALYRPITSWYELSSPYNAVNWDVFDRLVAIGTRMCDNVTDATMYPLSENYAQQALYERRNGLGIMGLAEMLIKLGLRYGSKESVEFIDYMMSRMAKVSYLTSADLAEEKGSFGMFDAEKYIEGQFVKRLCERFPEVREAILTKGQRNVTKLTIAPTGSTGTMVGTSTGCEPFYMWEWLRKGRLGAHKESVRIYNDYVAEHPGEPLPDYFVTAMDLSPKEHVLVQATLQKWVDSAISKTANCPSDFTVEDTMELYEYAWKLGCKGVTMYRDGSRDIQVLSKAQDSEPAKVETTTALESSFEDSRVCEIRWEDGQMIRECH